MLEVTSLKEYIVDQQLLWLLMLLLHILVG